MNIRTVFIRAAIAAVLLGGFVAITHAPHALAAQDSVTMSVDARAPLHASLLPTVSVVAAATDATATTLLRVAAVESLPVTLLPTVHVTAHVSAFITTIATDSVDARIASARD
ncbi:hypothetical protein [Dokdonella soli]|uniref:Uncharacterized protein n=1 Tax=Dokdonella soli TaxID=529810 RepID=A0ABP3TNL0_9GAMM